MRKSLRVILAVLLAAIIVGLCTVITIAILDKWTAPRIGVVVTATAALLTLVGLLAALESNNYLRREQLAEQRESAFQRTIDREMAYRNRSIEAVSAIVAALVTAINRYEYQTNPEGRLAAEPGEIGVTSSSEQQSVRQKYLTWQYEWKSDRGALATQLLYVPVALRPFLEGPLEHVNLIATGVDRIEHVSAEVLADGRENCRLAKQGIKYFEGLAAANLDPQVGAVLEYFTNVGSGPLVEPDTGNLVGPNYPDVRRQSEIHYVPRSTATPQAGLRRILGRIAQRTRIR